ncbi:hypothetical protein L1987_08068 [Smallanthus sonchifolius]|uniref:Uncharacterized protein n=1 Tax=Smallanthus sonchifolius TaxID=185202 RepID=A0ACB9JLV9_9ASTR|nr:hypothetical protein L1987_08068 [Smallanthus sonchifolius]
MKKKIWIGVLVFCVEDKDDGVLGVAMEYERRTPPLFLESIHIYIHILHTCTYCACVFFLPNFFLHPSIR